jgi:hypothetical protein
MPPITNHEKNKLYYGDNLQVLREYIPDQSVDLIYLDPPFNSRQDYNVLFAEKDGTRSASQITAFKDTWEWNEEAARSYEEVIEQGGRVADAMRAFRTLLNGSDMLAYLAMMAPRLIELRRVLKETGSIYLHCDPHRQPLPKNPARRCLRTTVFSQRDRMEAHEWAQRCTQKIRRSKRYHPLFLKIGFFDIQSLVLRIFRDIQKISLFVSR